MNALRTPTRLRGAIATTAYIYRYEFRYVYDPDVIEDDWLEVELSHPITPARHARNWEIIRCEHDAALAFWGDHEPKLVAWPQCHLYPQPDEF